MAIKRKRILMLLGLLVLILVGLIVVGWPQHYFLTRSLEQVLGTRVDVEGMRLGSTVTFKTIKIYPSDPFSENEPFATMEGLILSYDLNAKNGRKASKLHIKTLHIKADASIPESPNYQFLLDMLQAESTSDDTTWIPETIQIDSISVDSQWNDESVVMSNIQLDVALRTLSDIGVVIKIDDKQEGSHTVRGQVAMEFQGEEQRTAITELSVDVSGEQWISLAQALIPDTQMSLTRAEVKVPSLIWDSKKSVYPDGIVSVTLNGLEVFQEGESLYAGDPVIHTVIYGGDSLQVDMVAMIHPQMQAEMFMTHKNERNRGTINFGGWQKDHLLETVPSSLRSSIENLPFKLLGGSVNFDWDDVKYAVKGGVRSDGEAIDIDWAVHGDMESVSSVLGTVDARVGDGLLQASGKMDDAGLYHGEIQLKDVPLGPFALLATGAPLPDSVAGTMNGQVLAQQLDANRVQVSPKITFSDTHYNAFSFAPLTLEGPVVLDYDTRMALAKTVSLKTEDESIVLNATDFQLNLDSGDLKGNVAYTFPVETFEIENVYGTVSGTADLNKKGNAWSIPVHFNSDYLGYGDLQLPYGSELTGKGLVQFSEDSSVVTLSETHAKIGEGTLLIIPKARMDEAGWKGTAQVESELSLLVDMAYVAEVDGVFSAQADWTLPASGFSAEWTAKSDIAKMVLNDQAATISGMVAHLDGNYNGALQGEGAITIERLDAAGAALTAFSGPLLFEDNVLVIPESTTQVFKGTLQSRIEVRVMDEGLPVDFKGTLKDINLATLTEEVQPPKTKMTGIAQGTVDAQYSLAEGLIGFDLNVDSDKDFTLNRSLVEEMMQMQTVLSGLSEKRAKKAMDKFLGKADQRPFDSAGMNIFLLNGSVLGVTELHSEKTDDYNGLNLVIQLDIDKPALVQSLKMLEESSLADVEF